MIVEIGCFISGAVVGGVAVVIFHTTILKDIQSALTAVSNGVAAIKTKLGA